MMIDEDGAVHHHQQQDCFDDYDDEEEEEEEDDDDDDLSLHDLLQDKLERIAYLENAKQVQDEHLVTMQRERLEESL
jgi:hypothetical protein